ncbi:hypothetical protein E2C01_037795 [Portunus trituberculatus]|uniref:Uncharacterized protein n=1 Tax=Portunus trituberculatus TaxID=210409 RepID=A0A5B7FAA3_PORTR|nr:hypothetical protein [Portunus trituberculatus]
MRQQIMTPITHLTSSHLQPRLDLLISVAKGIHALYLSCKGGQVNKPFPLSALLSVAKTRIHVTLPIRLETALQVERDNLKGHTEEI